MLTVKITHEYPDNPLPMVSHVELPQLGLKDRWPLGIAIPAPYHEDLDVVSSTANSFTWAIIALLNIDLEGEGRVVVCNRIP
jgi:hypothetical protein